MKITHLCRVSWPQTGGMEQSMGGLALAAARAGHEVRVVTLGSGPTSIDGVDYVRLRRLGPERYPFAAGLPRALAGSDVVHVHGVDGLADQAVRFASCPVGVSTHGGYFHTRRNWLIKQVALRTITKRTLRRASSVWFTSSSDREQFAPAGVSGTVVGDGLHLRPFLQLKREPQKGVWLLPGRVDRHKGVERALAVLARVKGVRLRVIGRCEHEGYLRELAAHAVMHGVADRVSFEGELSAEQWLEAFASAELALFPSSAEGFGLAVTEAMAAGVPVVVEDLPVYNDRLSRVGTRVRFDRAASAARGIKRARWFLPGDCTRSRQIAQRFDWSCVWPIWERAYERLL